MPVVLITGASGFIGRALSDKLSSRYELLRSSRRLTDGPGDFVQADITSADDLRKFDDYRVEALVHLAYGGASEDEAFEVNVEGTRRLLRYLDEKGSRRFILASSIAAAGAQDTDMLPDAVPISEHHRCLAPDAYGLSKAIMEEIGAYFCRTRPDLEIVALRIGAVFDDHASALPLPAHRVDGPIICTWAQLGIIALTDVLDAIACILAAAPRPGFRRYNLVGPHASCEDPVASIVRAWIPGVAARLDLSYFEQPEREFAPVYAMEALQRDYGFRPRIPVSHRANSLPGAAHRG